MQGTKYVMWVEDVVDEDEFINVIGHKVLSSTKRSLVKYNKSFDYEWLRSVLGNCFEEIKQEGRVFYYWENDEGEQLRIDLPFYPPMTDEQKKSVQEWVEEMFKNAREE